LINNAGITKDGLLMRMKEEAWDAVIDTNLKGVFLCSREAMRYGQTTVRQDCEHFFRAAFMGNPGRANYSASKAGIVGFTKRSPEEYAGRVTVNAVCPGLLKQR
jgi:3-oxoacyl-[acyl-carrier protein] reductase